MAEYIPSPIKWVADQVELYESSGGLEGITYKVEGDPLRDTGLPVIIVTHTGLKTGAIRKTPLIRVADGDNYILIATYGGNPNHPAWYHNLKANPTVEIRDKTQVFKMIATEMPESPERDRLWSLGAAVQPLYDEYQSKLERLVPLFLASPIS